jgi:hypothetical protein
MPHHAARPPLICHVSYDRGEPGTRPTLSCYRGNVTISQAATGAGPTVSFRNGFLVSLDKAGIVGEEMGLNRKAFLLESAAI